MLDAAAAVGEIFDRLKNPPNPDDIKDELLHNLLAFLCWPSIFHLTHPSSSFWNLISNASQVHRVVCRSCTLDCGIIPVVLEDNNVTEQKSKDCGIRSSSWLQPEIPLIPQAEPCRATLDVCSFSHSASV